MLVASWGIPDALTEQAADLHAVWRIFLIAGAIVGLLVYGLLVFALIRYRRRDDLLPRQVHNRIAVELAYTLLPVLVIAGLLAVTLEGIDDTDAVIADPDLVIDVTGSQWRWSFDYQDLAIDGDGDLTDVPELVLPTGSSVRFNVMSDDVIHSFWVPGFFFKRDLIPGEVQSFDVDMGDRTGTWTGKCAEYCGLNHFSMQFTLHILTPAAFETWVADQ